MARFDVSRAAASDLRNIGRYTQDTWGAEQRRAYLDGRNAKFQFLADHPKIAPLRTDFSPPVRIHGHEKHLVVYAEQDSGGVLIVRVLHQNMDVPSKLSGRGRKDTE